MTSRRPDGAGTIDKLASGRWRVRVTIDGQRRPLGTYATRDEAQAILDAAVRRIADGSVTADKSPTLAAFGRYWLPLWARLNDVRDLPTERGRWERHVYGSTLGQMQIASIRQRHVRDFCMELLAKPSAYGGTLDRQTVKHVVGLVRRALAYAVIEERIPANPAAEFRVPKVETADSDADEDGEAWSYLTPDEQRTLTTTDALPEWLRVLIGVAIGTGLRQGELWNLRLVDVVTAGNEPHLWVRYGSYDRARQKARSPKSRKARRVPLFGLGLASMRRWLEILPTYATLRPRGAASSSYHNPHGLVFPTERGARRQRSRAPEWREHMTQAQRLADGMPWAAALRAAGVRYVRFHDLRHTCASSLVAGWWGRQWSTEEVKALLGHADLKTTQRYAHLAPSVLSRAAHETSGHVTNETKGRPL